MPTTDGNWSRASGAPPPPALLTTAETAARTGISESALKRGRVAGRTDLPTPVMVGHRVYYRADDVDAVAALRARGAEYVPPAKRAEP